MVSQHPSIGSKQPPTKPEQLSTALSHIEARMRAACVRSGRNWKDVTLVAVSKKHPASIVQEAHQLGVLAFGENYLQELETKQHALKTTPGIRWHFVGRLQSNKTKRLVQLGAVIESVDSLKVAQKLSRNGLAERKHVEIFLQVNLGQEPQKAGCTSDSVKHLVSEIRSLPNLTLRGLMTVPPTANTPEENRQYFRTLRRLGEENRLSELSMGMSADFEIAIEEGASSIRVGTALFGPRPTG